MYNSIICLNIFVIHRFCQSVSMIELSFFASSSESIDINVIVIAGFIWLLGVYYKQWVYSNLWQTCNRSADNHYDKIMLFS